MVGIIVETIGATSIKQKLHSLPEFAAGMNDKVFNALQSFLFYFQLFLTAKQLH